MELNRVPHDRFKHVVDAFADAAERLSLDETNCVVHLTGGNKLMAMAAAEWCRLAGVPCFYLERDLRVFPFLPRQTDLLPQESFQLDRHLARHVEPIALLRCQIGGATIVGPGQRLVLNQRGRELSEEEFASRLADRQDFKEFLTWDVPEKKDLPGFALEFATAVAILRLGVPVVQRSVRLAPRILRGSGFQEGELDLVFNWAGKLWVVDCKDRLAADHKVARLRHEIGKQCAPSPRLSELLDKIEEELRERDLHPLKEDLLAVAEVGGLLGRAICVRGSHLPRQAEEFAQSRQIDVIPKDRLSQTLRNILFPDEPASLEGLHALASTRTRARS